MPIQTRRWDDLPGKDEGRRILVTRYRPRGVAKAAETWDEWIPALGPSKALHSAVYTDRSSRVSWETYRRLYLKEQLANRGLIEALAAAVAGGATITLLCSSACVRESRCHRSLLRELIEAAIAGKSSKKAREAPIVRPGDVSDFE
jgi:uncharacterized protein YeaO (DUF488 family)